MSDTNKAGVIPLRNFRAPNNEWLDAKAEAKRRGEPLSKALRRFLRDYAAGRDPYARKRQV